MNTELLPKGGRVLCAVSGGADSIYLLCRLSEMGYDVCAAHYNHGIRGAEADRDETFVRELCAGRGIPFVSERGDTPAFAKRMHLGMEEAARTLRYDFLERAADEMGAVIIATAHTADDNAETLLLNLARGTGLKGLCGIPPVRGRIIRPMLDVTRPEVEAYLHERSIPHVEDVTNRSDDYARNRVRHGAVPVLETVNPAFVRTAGQTAALLREDEAFLSSLAEQFVARYGDKNTVPAAELLAQPLPVASRVIRRMAGRELTCVHVQAALKTARDGGGTDVPGLRIARTGDRLVFGAEEAEPIKARPIPAPGEVFIPEADMRVICRLFTSLPQDVHKSFNIFYFNYENICGSITVTARMPGDSFRPAGRGCTKTLHRLFQELGIPRWERTRVPVLRDEAGIMGVYGVGPAERACARPGDAHILQIEFIRQTPGQGG